MATTGLNIDTRSDSTSGSAPQAQRAGLTARRAGARTTGVLGAWPARRGPETRDDFGELGPRGPWGVPAAGHEDRAGPGARGDLKALSRLPARGGGVPRAAAMHRALDVRLRGAGRRAGTPD